MVDLAEAGARLREVRLDSPAPVAVLERRTTRRARRRRLVGRGAAGAFVAGVIVAAVVATVTLLPGRPQNERLVTGPPTSASPATSPGPALPAARPLRPVHHAAGARPVDWGRLRLWLPPGWQADMSPPSCPADRTVYFTITGVSACTQPQPPGSTVSYVEVEPEPLVAPSVAMQVRRVNGVAVNVEAQAPPTAGGGLITEDVPSLGVQLLISGAGRSVADTLGPSSYAAFSDAAYPVAVPASWKTVTYKGLEVRVPRSWPVRTLSVHYVGPGGCGPGGFAVPEVDLGPEKVAPHLCPTPPPSFPPPMVNGVWLQPYVVDQMGLPGPVQRLRRTGRLTLTLLGPGPVGSYAMEADVTATNGNRRISIAIGLGAEPTVAEAILSSIRPTS